MNDIIKEVDSLIAEMNTLEKFNDDLFIEYFEKVYFILSGGGTSHRMSKLSKLPQRSF